MMASMADFRPFKALRYNPAVAGNPDHLVAPPYDVVSDADKRNLYARSPYNVSRIDYGEDRPGDSDAENRYSRAKQQLDDWRAKGVMVLDEEPALYIYDQEFSLYGERHRRRSVFGRLRLEEFEKGIVLPHEVTGATAKADRLRILQATNTHLSPVMCLYESEGVPSIDDGDLEEPVLDAHLDGDRHTLRPVNAGAAAAFCAAIAGKRLFIADGHHRYETGINYRNERKAAASSWTGEEPENFIVAALVAADDPGLIVLPTDRVLNLPNADIDLVSSLKDLFELRSFQSLDELSAAVAANFKKQPAFGIVGPRHQAFTLAVPRDIDAVAARTPAGHTDAWRRLDVTVLHHALLASLGFSETLENIDYTEDHGEAAHLVETGKWDAAFLLNPTPVEQVIAVAGAHDRMPRKSTFFFPKLGTGIVLLPLE
jgi:uncharacterized protein (DUF1015 family)